MAGDLATKKLKYKHGKPDFGPSRLMLKQAENLFPDVDERQQFVDALQAGESRELAIIVMKEEPAIRVFPRQGATQWQPQWVIRLDPEFKASKHPLYAKGAYYSLDFSSIFSASAMLAMDKAPRTVLDLCSSPGGKAVFTYRAFHPAIMVCNETIRKRARTLIDNLERCGIEGSRVWSADPSVYAKRWPETMDLVICDAPCSGQSLLAKGSEAEGCWSPTMIDMNVGRQRRITAHGAKCLRPGGYLLYATCTFSVKENEKVIAWLMEQYEDLHAVEVPHLAEFRSKYADFPAYRLFPMQQLGAGAFCCLLRRDGERPEHLPTLDDLPGSWKFGDVREPRAVAAPVAPVPNPFPTRPARRAPTGGSKSANRGGRSRKRSR